MFRGITGCSGGLRGGSRGLRDSFGGFWLGSGNVPGVPGDSGDLAGGSGVVPGDSGGFLVLKTPFVERIHVHAYKSTYVRVQINVTQP